MQAMRNPTSIKIWFGDKIKDTEELLKAKA